MTKRWYPPAGWSRRAIERELTRQAAEFERQVQAGEIVSRKEKAVIAAEEAAEAARIPTVAQYVENVYLPQVAIQLSENTRSGYLSLLNSWILPRIATLKMPEVSPSQISSILLAMQKEGRAHSSRVKCFAVLHSLFKAGFMDGTIETDPMLKVRRPTPGKEETQKEITAHTPEELQRIMTALKDCPLKWCVFFNLVIFTGMRRGEACGLQWKDIDFMTGEVQICRTLNYTPSAGIYVSSPKSGRGRAVFVGDQVLSLLRQLREEQASTCISKWVFTQDRSPEPMHPQSPSAFCRQLSKACGIPNLHVHQLRHDYASLALENGADVVSVSAALGHADPSITLKVYAHASRDALQRVSDTVATAIKQA